MECAKITADMVAAVCGQMPIGGTYDTAWIFNYDDINKSLTDTSATKTDIVMNEDKRGYIFTSLDNSFEGTASLNVGTYIRNYDHQVTLRMFTAEYSAKAWLADLKDSRVVVVLKRKGNPDPVLEVYGITSGLKLSENNWSTTLTDNVAAAPVLKSDDTGKEENLPQTYDGTEEELNALCQEPSTQS